MAILNRIGRLFKADMHAVIDRLEEPQMLLKQSVREMEEYLNQDRQQLKQLQQQYAVGEGRIKELQASLTDATSELDLCFEANDERLARALIKRKLESQQLIKVMESRQVAIQHDIDDLIAKIDERVPLLEAMKQKLELFVDETTERETVSTTTPVITDADIEVALLREKQLREKALRSES